MGIGHGTGENRAVDAAKAAISSPLLESSIDGAKGVLLSIAGPTDLSLHEVNAAADHITRVAHPDANIIFGAVVDDALGEEVRVTVVAAGFDKLATSSTETSRFESRLSRLLEEPVRTGGHEDASAVDPGRRRRRGHGRVHDRERPRAGDGVVRCRGGPGHPGLPEELTDPVRPRAASRCGGRGGSERGGALPPPLGRGAPRPPFHVAFLQRWSMTASRDEVTANLEEVREGIARACERAAATSTRSVSSRRPRPCPPEAIRWAFDAGVTDFGENYVKELRTKRRAVPDARWHFIGTLQTNTRAPRRRAGRRGRDGRRRSRRRSGSPGEPQRRDGRSTP